MKPLVYIAGPISSNPMHGTHEALVLATRILDDGIATPIVPHLTVLWDTVFPRPYEEWMEYDFGLLDHCHAVFRLQGVSPGADRETAWMRERGRKMFGDEHNYWTLHYGAFMEWCEKFTRAHA